MIFDAEGPSPTNLSPYGEWRYSMMGLAGRDPIFFAQLDTESDAARASCRQKKRRRFCSGPVLSMPRRDGPAPVSHRSRERGPKRSSPATDCRTPNRSTARWRATAFRARLPSYVGRPLLGAPSTYTGLFKVGPATEVYGPFLPIRILAAQRAVRALSRCRCRTLGDHASGRLTHSAGQPLCLMPYDCAAGFRCQRQSGDRKRPARKPNTSKPPFSNG